MMGRGELKFKRRRQKDTRVATCKSFWWNLDLVVDEIIKA